MLRSDISPIENIPPDVLGAIFKLLDDNTNQTLSRVNKEWYKKLNPRHVQAANKYFNDYFISAKNSLPKNEKKKLRSLAVTLHRFTLYGSPTKKAEFIEFANQICLLKITNKDLGPHKTVNDFATDPVAIEKYCKKLHAKIKEAYLKIKDNPAITNLYELINPLLEELLEKPENLDNFFKSAPELKKTTSIEDQISTLENNNMSEQAYALINIAIFLKNYQEKKLSVEIASSISKNDVSLLAMGSAKTSLRSWKIPVLGAFGSILTCSGGSLLASENTLPIGITLMIVGVMALLAIVLFCILSQGKKSKIVKKFNTVSNSKLGLFQLTPALEKENEIPIAVCMV